MNDNLLDTSTTHAADHSTEPTPITVAQPDRRGAKIFLILVLVMVLGGAGVWGYFYWQDHFKSSGTNSGTDELSKIKKEKEDLEKNQQAISEKMARQEEEIKNLRLAQSSTSTTTSDAEEKTETTSATNNESTGESSLPLSESKTATTNSPAVTTTPATTPLPEATETAEINIDESKQVEVGTGFTIPKDSPIGFIKKVYEKDGKHYLDIDYIQFWLGDEAVAQIKKDGKCQDYGEGPDCYPLDGYYLKNVNPLIRTFEIDDGVEVYMTSYPQSQDGNTFGSKINYSQFKKLMRLPDDGENGYLKKQPYYIVLDHGKVIIIAERFIP